MAIPDVEILRWGNLRGQGRLQSVVLSCKELWTSHLFVYAVIFCCTTYSMATCHCESHQEIVGMWSLRVQDRCRWLKVGKSYCQEGNSHSLVQTLLLQDVGLSFSRNVQCHRQTDRQTDKTDDIIMPIAYHTAQAYRLQCDRLKVVNLIFIRFRRAVGLGTPNTK